MEDDYRQVGLEYLSALVLFNRMRTPHNFLFLSVPKHTTMDTMKAVNYTGPNKVQVQQVDRPKLEHPDDVIVKVTTVRLC